MPTQEGSTAVLDREIPPPLTSTDARLELEERTARIVSGTQDNSITVIENPSLDGYIGLLLAESFQRQGYQNTFVNVLHIRVNEGNSSILTLQPYERASIGGGFDQRPYNFVVTDRGLVLPALSILQYEIAFIPPEAYSGFHHGLTDGFNRGQNVGKVLGDIYKLLVKEVPTFSLENGRLVLPQNYASHRI